MRLIVTGGGTGGHLFPGIAVAKGVQEKFPESKVLFIKTARQIDVIAFQGQGIEEKVLHCSGLKGKGSVARLKSLIELPGAVIAALKIIKEFQPDLVFGVGGYVTGPVLLAAKFARVPVAIHEQNSVPGLANRLAGRIADQICISLPCEPPFPPGKTRLTGNPVRKEILSVARKERRDVDQPLTIGVLGGSQGAHQVNMLMTEALAELAETGLACRVIHQTGAKDQERVQAAYAASGVSATVQPFFKNMAELYSQADLVVSRAGATTLAELSAIGIPAILIPYPFAADNHQVKNGAYYVRGGGAVMIEESELSGEILGKKIRALLQDQAKRESMATAMASLGVPGATENIIEVGQQLIK